MEQADSAPQAGGISMTLSLAEPWIKAYDNDIHLLLYFKGYLFDMNLDIKSIRPYNSPKWYTISEEVYEDFIDYLKEIYDKCVDFTISEEDKDIYGITMINNVVAIDLWKLRRYLNSSLLPQKRMLSIAIALFIARLITLYNMWNDALRLLLSHQDSDGDNIFQFKF